MRCTTKPERLANDFTGIQAAWVYRLRVARLEPLETIMLVGHGLKP